MQTKEHPDELTPREREVFGLVRLGLTNEEIAERLGISLDGAKYHVSQILSKLGVATREEAAALSVPVAEAFQPRRGRWWVMFPLAAKAAGVAVVLATVGGLGVLAWGVLNTSDGTEAEDSAPLAVDGPRIGDHWHAPYQFFACGVRQPNASAWESGVHTHADGIFHIHPFQTYEEGPGSRLVKWFEYGGGLLTETEIRIPGSAKTFRNGDLCPDGEPGELQVFVTRAGESAEDPLLGDALQQYIPHDGDRIRIAFQTEGSSMLYEDRTVIPEDQATRTVEIAVTDDGTEDSTHFQPDRIEVSAGETVKIVVRNSGTVSHGFRAAGDDGVYASRDDFVVSGDIIPPGGEGLAVVRLDDVGETEFRDDTWVGVVTGVIVVLGPSGTPIVATPRPSDAPLTPPATP